MNQNKQDFEIAILHQISRTVLHEHNVSLLLRDVLNVLHREIGFKRGTFTLLRDDTLYIEASHGLTDEELKRGKYRLGEGITGRVGEKGVPILIPDITKDPNFLNRTKARGQLQNVVAFLCVPIIYMEKVIGTLSMDRDITPETNLPRDMKLLETVANIMADAVELCRQEHEEREILLAENQRLRDELDGRGSRPASLIGNCNRMRFVYTMIDQVANTGATVLITGSSGTGKELVARAIRQGSPRKNKPFILLSCAAIPESMMESELFGHEKGAVAGASSRYIGKLEAAEGGTVYLDEIGALPPSAQVKLLHLLQDRVITRTGGSREIPLDVRIIAGTSRNLEKSVESGKFREDLYYRLNVFPIQLPDLRERRSDIVLLAEHFLEKFNRTYGKNIKRISTPAINMMMSYHWPGNVRELENCIERAVLTSQDDVISGYHLPPSLQTGESGTAAQVADGKADFTTLVNSFERELIVEALKVSKGNISAAARSLNITNRIINYKIQKLHITPEWYKISGE